MNKIKYTVWIGKNDDLPYGYDMELSLKVSDPTNAMSQPLDMNLDIAFNMNIKRINEGPVIEAPVIEAPLEEEEPAVPAY